jgi:hypothetical protein
VTHSKGLSEAGRDSLGENAGVSGRLSGMRHGLA